MTSHKTHIDDLNIETKLFEVDGEFRVRVRDLDAGENVSLVSCVDRNQAEAKIHRSHRNRLAAPTPAPGNHATTYQRRNH